MVGGGGSKKKITSVREVWLFFLELHTVSVKRQLEHKQCTFKVVNKLGGFQSRYSFSDIKFTLYLNL